jgi:Domain of unknown function (DUF4936)
VSLGAARLYVYYRVRPGDAPVLIAAVRALQAQWQAAHPGLVCSLSQRGDAAAEALTLMETYAHAGGVPANWQAEIERDARDQLGAWIVGERHVEVFVPCA